VVTGGAGFIGSHLVDALLGDGTEVTVVDDLSSGSERQVADAANLEVVDIADRPALDAVVDAVRPSAVYHVAAQSSVTASVADPGRDCAVNVQGTLNVLEAATRHRAPVVFTSTGGALYGNEAPIPTAEDHLPAPAAPYGASKWAGEAYVITWATASGLPHAVLRLGNVYGPRQNPHGEAGVAVLTHPHAIHRGVRPPGAGTAQAWGTEVAPAHPLLITGSPSSSGTPPLLTHPHAPHSGIRHPVQARRRREARDTPYPSLRIPRSTVQAWRHR
jgi:UDP-glucose 4-epimerase